MKAHAPTACECGCGITVKDGKHFVRGHWSRTPEARAGYTARRQQPINPNTSGLCACGCGQTTPLASDNHPDRGYFKGQHVRYVPGHSAKKGAASHKWKGGRWTRHPSGYVWIYAPDHPHTNAKGYVYEHRLVVEKRLGRILDPAERVHHLNRDRSDNRDENLILFPSHSAHMLEHGAPKSTNAQRSIAGKKGAEARWRGKR